MNILLIFFIIHFFHYFIVIPKLQHRIVLKSKLSGGVKSNKNVIWNQIINIKKYRNDAAKTVKFWIAFRFTPLGTIQNDNIFQFECNHKSLSSKKNNSHWLLDYPKITQFGAFAIVLIIFLLWIIYAHDAQ